MLKIKIKEEKIGEHVSISISDIVKYTEENNIDILRNAIKTHLNLGSNEYYYREEINTAIVENLNEIFKDNNKICRKSICGVYIIEAKKKGEDIVFSCFKIKFEKNEI